MPDSEQTKNTTAEKSDLRRCVFDSINEKDVQPKARCWFTMRRVAIWSLWVATIVLGALTTAVLLYVARFQQYALYEVTHRDGLAFIISVLPVVWILLFITIVIVAFLEMRYTEKGYKHSCWKLIGGTVATILVFGIVFEIANLGHVVDKKLGGMTKMYASQEAREASMWQKPMEGRLIGTTEAGDFTDVSGATWEISEVELMEEEKNLLNSGREVKIYGTSTADGLFVACGVLPTLATAAGRRELRESRQQFVKKVKDYRGLTQAELVAQNGTNTKPCRKLPIYNRP